jgi:hypothetical protein
VVGNKDIEHLTAKIVRSITNPDEVPEIMHALAGVTFVQSVQSPALAMVVPLVSFPWLLIPMAKSTVSNSCIFQKLPITSVIVDSRSSQSRHRHSPSIGRYH